MAFKKDKVIVLKSISFGEADKIIRTLSQTGALKSFIAKGALKSKKRFLGGVLEPGHFIGVEYKTSHRTNLHNLRQAWFLKRFNKMRTNYDKLRLGLYFLSLIEKISQEGMECSHALFNLLGNSLSALETSRNLPALRFVFEFRLLLIQGVLPPELQSQKNLLNITVQEHNTLNLSTKFNTLHTIAEKALDRYAFEK